MLFSALVMRYVSENQPRISENGKLLQVTIIKITESKENKSIQRPIQRLDGSCSTGPGGSPPLATRYLSWFVMSRWRDDDDEN